MLHYDLERGLALEREPAGQHLVHDHAERINIRPVGDLAALGLLGRDIVHRADGLLHHARLLRRREGRDAEIGQLCGAVAQDDDVLRLDVLMDDAARMRMNEGARDLFCEENTLLPRQAALLLKIFLEGHALDELHHDIIRAVLVSDVIDRNDIVMAELGDSTGLDGKALADVGVLGELLLEDLDRHISSEYGIARAVNYRHAADADHV